MDSAGKNSTVLNHAAAVVVSRIMNVDDGTARRVLDFIQVNFRDTLDLSEGLVPSLTATRTLMAPR